MRMLVFFFLLMISLSSQGSDQLIGQWQLSGMIHQGKEIPLPNPHLRIVWTFFENGTERLYWDRGGPEFCERFAFYSFDSDFLTEKTFALNPKNAIDCAQDPDMQIGRETKTRIEFSSQEIRLYLQLGDDQLVYVLKPHHEWLGRDLLSRDEAPNLSQLVSVDQSNGLSSH